MFIKTFCKKRIEFHTDMNHEKIINANNYKNYCVSCEGLFDGKGGNLIHLID